MIALKIKANIQVIQVEKDEEDRIIILKTLIENETITLGYIYDENHNSTKNLDKMEELLRKVGTEHGHIMGGDYNVITDKDLDQFGYPNQNTRTKAAKKLRTWEETGNLIDIYRKVHKKGREITYVPDMEHNREKPKLGRRLDKFLVSEDMNIKKIEVKHVSDNVYKLQYNMQKKFDHGSVRLTFNKKVC